MSSSAHGPAVRLVLLGTKVGATVGRVVLTAAAERHLAPLLLEEQLLTAAQLRRTLGAEAVRVVLVRVSLRSPRRLAWLTSLLADLASVGGVTGTMASLARRSLRHQVGAFGLQGVAASTLAALAVQAGLSTCVLLTSNLGVWRAAERMSLAQYRYDLLTHVYAGGGAAVGGAVGAAVGSAVQPGLGTVVGSLVGSSCGGYLPRRLRTGRGPDRRRRAALREALAQARAAAPPPYTSREEEDEGDVWIVLEPAAAGSAAPPELGEDEDSVLLLRTRPTDDGGAGTLEGEDVASELRLFGGEGGGDASLSCELTGAALPDLTAFSEALGGQVHCGEARGWAELDALCDRCEDEEMLFVFRTEAAAEADREPSAVYGRK